MNWPRLFRRRRADDELREEIKLYLDEEKSENMARGLSSDEAWRQARIRLGNPQRIIEDLWQQNTLRAIEDFWRDLDYAAKALTRTPGFAITAICTLALSLGAITVLFSLVNALVLRPLPVPHAEELTMVQWKWAHDLGASYSFSTPVFRALEKRHEVFESIAGFSSKVFQVRSGSATEEVHGVQVSGDFFRVMQTPPLLGRWLTPQDDQQNGGSTGFTVVISEAFWRARFNRTPDILGRRLTISHALFTVVGVMPKQFIGPDPTRQSEIYTPLWAEPVVDAPYNKTAGGYDSMWIGVIARRNPGVSLREANAVLKATTHSILNDSIPDTKWLSSSREHGFQIVAEPGWNGYSYLRAFFTRPLLTVFSLCAVMLLLACLNLATLLMARSATRERELATRLALGATRVRLIKQLMVESLLIALLGTGAALISAPVVSQSLVAFILGNDPTFSLKATLDLRVFAFASLTAVAVTVFTGLIPALSSTSKRPNKQIKFGLRAFPARERRVLPRIFMGCEVALALMLVVCAGLLATSLTRLYRAGIGFDPQGILNINLNMSQQALDGVALVRWYRIFGDAISHQSRVKDVSFASITPMSGYLGTADFHTNASGARVEMSTNDIAPAYFRTLRIPLLTGRDFQWNDTPSAGHKIILSRTAVKRLFPDGDAVGQFVQDDNKVKYEIVGVVDDVRYLSIREDMRAEAYFPIMQSEDKKPSYAAVVRVEGSALPVSLALRALAAKMAPDVPAPVITLLGSDVDASIGTERFMAMLAVFFAACGLLVTAVGLYGTLAYVTARRTSEIGLRIALGARRQQILRMVFRENAWIAAGGSLLGLVIAYLASRALASYLYGTSVHDPWVLLASVAVLASAASAASLLPALRAARLDPMQAIREE
jgi:predicted permease